MNAIRTAALAAALAFVATPGFAMTAADLANGKAFAAAGGGELWPSRPTRQDRFDAAAAGEETQRYFDFDTLITLGALVVAGGGLSMTITAARRKSAEPAQSHDRDWRESVFQELQAELIQFTEGFRRAA